MVQNNTITVVFPYANDTENNDVVPRQYIPFSADRERYPFASNSCENIKASKLDILHPLWDQLSHDQTKPFNYANCKPVIQKLDTEKFLQFSSFVI
jgi:hypothetical protein